MSRQYSYPGTREAGFINIEGDIGSGTNLYLNSGRAIRIDATGPSVLNFGNYQGDSPLTPAVNESGTNFTLTLHAQNDNLAELILQQGSNDRWSLSVRPGATTTPDGGDFEIRAGRTGWPRALAIDYATGNVTIDTNVTVSGDLLSNTLQVQGNAVVGGNLTATGDAAATRLCIGADCRAAWPAAGSTATGTGGRLALFTGAGLSTTLGDSIISQSAGTITVGTLAAPGSITATGCFGPIFRANTVPSYDGTLQEDGTTNDWGNGYIAAHLRCGPGRHICTAEEMLVSVRCATATSPILTTAPGTQAWILAGPPGDVTNANDCNGLTSNATGEIGRAWNFDANGGNGDGLSCNAFRSFACCS